MNTPENTSPQLLEEIITETHHPVTEVAGEQRPQDSNIIAEMEAICPPECNVAHLRIRRWEYQYIVQHRNECIHINVFFNNCKTITGVKWRYTGRDSRLNELGTMIHDALVGRSLSAYSPYAPLLPA